MKSNACKIDGCSDICKGKTIPLCDSKSGSSVECDTCYKDHNASYYNLKQGTCLSEQEYSFLVSYGFIALFATAGLISGSVADAYNRKRLIGLFSLLW